MLGDYSAVKNGSYGKLMRAYYQVDKPAKTTTTSKPNKTEETEKTQKPASVVTQAQNMFATAPSVTSTKKADKESATAATKLVESIDALDKLTYKEENRDKIAEGVTAFVEEYNKTLKAASESNLINVAQNAKWMASGTKSNQKLLASIGININEDNTLSFDKEVFGKASITTARSVLDGSASFAHQVSNRAAKIYAEAASAGTAASAYSSTGDYTAATTGAMLDGFM